MAFTTFQPPKASFSAPHHSSDCWAIQEQLVNRLLTEKVRSARHLASGQKRENIPGPAGGRRPREDEIGWKQKSPGEARTQVPTSVTIPPLRRQPSQSPQKIPNKPRVPSVSDPPPLRVCSAGKLRQGVRVDSFLPAYIARKAKLFFPPLLRTTRDNREGREDGEGVESDQGLGKRPTLPHSRWRRGRGEVPQRRYQRMRSAESRPGTQDGGSGAGEGEAEAAKRAVEQNVWPHPLESVSGR